MTSKKEENGSAKQAQKRIAEIARILCAGIKRLNDRESSQNSLNQLDYKTSGSLHSIDSNPNQQFML
jgi:hypothetical protein